MLDVKSTLTVITLDVCGLNTNFKADWQKNLKKNFQLYGVQKCITSDSKMLS